MNISGRAAVVTGGASGIGQAVARRIYADGGNIIIFDLNAEAGAAMVEEILANCSCKPFFLNWAARSSRVRDSASLPFCTGPNLSCMKNKLTISQRHPAAHTSMWV